MALTGVSSAALTAAAMLGSAFAAPMPQEDGNNESNDVLDTIANHFDIQASAIPAGIVLLVVGLGILLFGARLWRLTIVLVGGYFMAMLAWMILINIEPTGGWDSHLLIYYITLGVAFLIGAFLAWCLYRFGVFIVGLVAGAHLYLFISALVGFDSLLADWLRYVLLAVTAIVCGLLAVKFEPYVARIGTATLGAALFILGVDVFANTGVWQNVVQAIERGSGETVRDVETIVMIVAFFILAVLGSVIQFKKTARMDRKL